MCLCQTFDPRNFFAFLLSMHNIDGQVGTVEATDKSLRTFEAQLLDYIRAHIRRSRGRERNGLSAGPARAEGLNCNFQAQVIGPEIVAPG